ncbi:protein of unknown function [Burkholderia multivorans]
MQTVDLYCIFVGGPKVNICKGF